MFTMLCSGLPIGQYLAKFSKWGQSVHEQYGDRCLFEFTVLEGEHKDATSTRFTGAKLTPKSALAKVAAGLAGKKIEIGDDFNPDDYIGREYLIVVSETESGATRVDAILPA